MSSKDPFFLNVARSVTGRAWRLSQSDPRLSEAFCQRLGVPEIIGRLLAARNVSLDEGEKFLKPKIRDFMPDPAVFSDMERGATRLAKAIIGSEQVCVFGDYDVDGATSTALLKKYFQFIGRSLRVYIPDRQKEGYGPNKKALEKLRREGISLVVTVDCGIVAFDSINEASRNGLDIVIVDHHQAEPNLPACHAVINPKRLDDESHLGELAAVGVTFMLLIALSRTLRKLDWFQSREEPDLLRWLDIVALGTICDVVPIHGLNRALVSQGLKVMAQRGNQGLNALQDICKINTRPTAYHLGFLIGPRINAGGRVGESDLGARILATSDRIEAQELARRLNLLNQERQLIEKTVLREAEIAFKSLKNTNKPLIFIAQKHWHEGVLGIVASRLKDRYRKPALVLSIKKGVAKGSARSIRGVDIGSAITAAKQEGLLIAGGGHEMAGGLSVEETLLDDLNEFLSERITRDFNLVALVPDLIIDGALSIKAAGNREFYDTLEQIGPFGAGNYEPRFVFPSTDIVKSSVFGEKHIRFVAASNDGSRISGVAFNAADRELGDVLLNSSGRFVHLAGHIRADDWQARDSVQFHLDDAAVG